MENTEKKYLTPPSEPKFKQGDRVLTPMGPGTIFEHFMGFYSVEVDRYRHDRYFEQSDLIGLESKLD